jgi:hypothetical protein
MPRLSKAQKRAAEEQAARLKAADLDCRKTLAMHRSEQVERDIPIPEAFNDLSRGWDFNSWDSKGRVFKACSNSFYHGDGWERVSSQHPRALFSTELLATKALRYELAEKFAEILVKWDRRIEELLNDKEAI